MNQYLLKMEAISKQFPGVKALDNVSLDIAPGEIHGLLGENGAGKSTLIKIMSGAYQPDAGTMELDGQRIHLANPHHAQALGIVTIYQEFNLVPSLTIAENVFIGREPGKSGFVDWGALKRETLAVTERLGIHLNPMSLVRNLSVADQQMVEIARALSMRSRVIIMDEPTSALSDNEVQQLFKIVRDLKAHSISIIFVTHRLEEVHEICDRITVLRDGRNVGSANVADIKTADIIRMMVGRSMDELFQRAKFHEYGDVALEVRGLSRLGTARDPNATVLNDISFAVRRGEILGIAGLVGAGRTELARAIFGADPFDSGQVLIDGHPVRIKSPQDAIRHGIGLVPEDRKQQALFLALAVRENLSIASLGSLMRWGAFVDEKAEMSLMQRFREALNIRMASPEQKILNLSGGNQQKVVIARWLALQPKVLIVDEPTRGIDVAAKAEVHQLLDEMARSGIAVIMISSELPEILGMSDRIITVREGRLTGEILRAEANEEKLMHLMTLSVKDAVA
jgi:inositol transport system ATP-binding protein